MSEQLLPCMKSVLVNSVEEITEIIDKCMMEDCMCETKDVATAIRQFVYGEGGK